MERDLNFLHLILKLITGFLSLVFRYAMYCLVLYKTGVNNVEEIGNV